MKECLGSVNVMQHLNTQPWPLHKERVGHKAAGRLSVFIPASPKGLSSIAIISFLFPFPFTFLSLTAWKCLYISRYSTVHMELYRYRHTTILLGTFHGSFLFFFPTMVVYFYRKVEKKPKPQQMYTTKLKS